MARKAAIVIGVNTTGGLTPLRSAARCADEVAEWLEAEGYDVACLTDADEPVTTGRVTDAMDRFVTVPPRYAQLVVYFTGHGYWHARADIWLLSKAPVRTEEAINLEGAIDLARYSGIRNVIFISDACRSLPDVRSGALVQGIDAFPNFADITTQSKIDVFRATSDAQAAYEAEVDGQPTSLLTHALRAAFREPEPDMLRDVGGKQVVPNRRLEKYLQRKIDTTLGAIDLNLRQRIEVNVPSDDDIYIATAAVAPSRPPPGEVVHRGAGDDFGMDDLPMTSGAEPASPEPEPPKSVPPAEAVPPAPSVLGDIRGNLDRVFSEPMGMSDSATINFTMDMTETVDRLSGLMPRPDVADHFESHCGFTISGARIEEAICGGAADGVFIERLYEGDGADQPAVVRLWDAAPGATVLLRTDDGRVLVLAGLPDFIGHATVGEAGLKNVSYIPSSNAGELYDFYREKQERIDRFRALVALAANENEFRLESDDAAIRLADEIRMVKALDPTLGLYAAHAYAQASKVEKVASVADAMRHDLHIDLFDLVVLTSRRGDPWPDRPVMPFCPLLTQTWNLLRPRGIELHPALAEASAYLRNALWTTFEAEAWDPLRAAMELGELR